MIKLIPVHDCLKGVMFPFEDLKFGYSKIEFILSAEKSVIINLVGSNFRFLKLLLTRFTTLRFHFTTSEFVFTRNLFHLFFPFINYHIFLKEFGNFDFSKTIQIIVFALCLLIPRLFNFSI